MEAPTDSRRLISEAVRAHIEEAGLTQAAISETTLIPTTTLSRYLSGGSIRVDHLWLIADALDTRPSVILARAEDAA